MWVRAVLVLRLDALTAPYPSGLLQPSGHPSRSSTSTPSTSTVYIGSAGEALHPRLRPPPRPSPSTPSTSTVYIGSAGKSLTRRIPRRPSTSASYGCSPFPVLRHA